MKKVIQGKELWEVMEQTVNLLCDAVSSTLGPTGNNVLINHWDKSPYITKDGVTIASSIESNNPLENTILEIVKEASLKTDELVGDGTTTTLVLLQSIFNQGIKKIKEGYNAILLKKELEDALKEILKDLEQEKLPPKAHHLLQIAITSANDEKIGRKVFEAYQKMKNMYSIRIQEGSTEEDYFEIKKGYALEIDKISSLYFQKEERLLWKNVKTLVVKGRLENLEEISEIVNEVLETKEPLLILAEELEQTVYEEILSLYLTGSQKILALTIPEYASHREGIEEDLIMISTATIKNVEYEKITTKDLGLITELKIEKETITITFKRESIKKHINDLKLQQKKCHNSYEKDFIEQRLSKLEKGVATIYVGGVTKTEIREKIMRYEDALCAIDHARNGVVVGEGVTFLKIKENLEEKNQGFLILKEAISQPFIKIMDNLGKKAEPIQQQIQKYQYQKVYEYKTDDYENINDTSILDSYDVITTALKNATNIASLLLTTNFLIINEKDKIEKDVL